MKKLIQKHLLDNHGDVYTYFLIFVIVILLMFSAIFGLMQLRIMTNNIYNEIETSADIVLATIKKDCYQTLIDGTTKNTEISLFSKDAVTNQLAEQLNATKATDQIIKTNDGKTIFIIRNIKVNYTDNIDEVNLSEIDGGLLKISFNIEIPIMFNGNIIHTVNKTYTKNTMLNFK